MFLCDLASNFRLNLAINLSQVARLSSLQQFINSGIHTLPYPMCFRMMPAAQQDEIIQLIFAAAGPHDPMVDGQSAEITRAPADFAKVAGSVKHFLSHFLCDHIC